MEALRRFKGEIKNEVNYIFTNVADRGNAEQIDFFVDKHIIEFFMNILSDDSEDDHGVFEALVSILVLVRVGWLLAIWRRVDSE